MENRVDLYDSLGVDGSERVRGSRDGSRIYRPTSLRRRSAHIQGDPSSSCLQ